MSRRGRAIALVAALALAALVGWSVGSHAIEPCVSFDQDRAEFLEAARTLDYAAVTTRRGERLVITRTVPARRTRFITTFKDGCRVGLRRVAIKKARSGAWNL